MRIAYCTNVRLPSERAHGHQIAHVADALVSLGHQVTVFAPYRKNVVAEDYWTYYGARQEVSLMHLGNFDPIASPWLPGVIGLWTLNGLMRLHLKTHLVQSNFDVIYTRSPALLSALLVTGIPVILELHQLPRASRRRFVTECNACALVACLTSSMRETLIEWGVDADKVIAEGDAVALERFQNVATPAEARAKFHIQTQRQIVGYVGRLKTLGMDKGVTVLLEALAELKDQQTFFGFIVGGPENDRKEYEAAAHALGLTKDDVLFTGEIPGGDVPAALSACDILAMPFPDVPHYRHHMSPLKMFEYMAAERPIVTSDLPTVRDVLSDETAIFCRPGDPKSLVTALRWIQDHQSEARARAQRARKLVENHTWQARMQRILNAYLSKAA